MGLALDFGGDLTSWKELGRGEGFDAAFEDDLPLFLERLLRWLAVDEEEEEEDEEAEEDAVAVLLASLLLIGTRNPSDPSLVQRVFPLEHCRMK